MAMRRLVVVLLLTLTPQARALDAPIAGNKLTFTWNSQLIGKLVFVSTDPAFLFPDIGSPDDPGTGSPGGANIFLFAGPMAFGNSIGIPSGAGWTSRTGAVDVHRWYNPEAPFGSAPVFRMVLKRGRLLKVVSRLVPMTETPPLGRVAIRINIGSQRNCAVFEAEDIRRDEPFRFVARGAPRPAAADCDTAISPTTTTTTTLPSFPCSASTPVYPNCGGECPPGEACGPNGALGGLFECVCLPAGPPPCAVSGYPLCGGVCLAGTVCQALHLQVGGVLTTCACVNENLTCGPPPPSQCVSAGVCPPGQVCYATTMPSFLCGCGSP